MNAEALYDKLKGINVGNPLCHYTLDRCRRLAPLIEEIEALKKERNAIILAHAYVHPDIIYGVADFVGDSYFLSKKAKETSADWILFPAVRFMAETAKILNPTKTVIDPNPNGKCSLADSIDENQVQALRKRYPDHTFVCYINTTAAVKAACDVCVTSTNAATIVERIENDKILFLPDKLMGENLQAHLRKKGIDKQLVLYDGTCYVHEEFTPEGVELIQKTHPGVQVLAHPECSPAVVEKSTFVGSTSEITDYVAKNHTSANPFLLLTECGIASRMQIEHPKAKFVGSCMLCKYMKSNSLEAILSSLKKPKEEQLIHLDEATRKKALLSIEKMFAYFEPSR